MIGRDVQRGVSGGRSCLLGDQVYLTPWADPLFPLWPLTLGRDFLSRPYQSEAQHWNGPTDQDLARNIAVVAQKNLNPGANEI